MRFDLSDEEWSVLEPLMPKGRKSARPHDRRIIDAIFYVLRTGIPWRDLPERYGPYTSAYNRFNRWSRRGVWKRIFDALAAKSRNSLYLIDSTIVKAHRATSGAKGGRKIRRLASAVVGRPRLWSQQMAKTLSLRDPAFAQYLPGACDYYRFTAKCKTAWTAERMRRCTGCRSNGKGRAQIVPSNARWSATL